MNRMNKNNPGSFLTSSITSGATSVGASAGIGTLSGGLQGAWFGASIGSMVAPGAGTLAGGVIGAGLGAVFGSLTATSKALNSVWDKLIANTRNLITTFAKFSPLLTAQQERWRHLDEQINRAWAKTLAPTLKHLTDVGVEISQRWARLKISVFKSWEGVINKLISALGALVKVTLSLSEFFEKLKALIMKLLGISSTPESSIRGTPPRGGESTDEYGRSRSARFGGKALLRGKFTPGTPLGGLDNKNLEFDWAKGQTGTAFSNPIVQQQFPLVVLVRQILNLLKGLFGNKPKPMTPEETAKVKDWLGKPATEAAREAARARIYKKFGTTPKKEGEPTSFLGGAPLPGAAGMVQRAAGMSVFASIPDPKIRLIKPGSTKAARLRREADELWKKYVKIKGWKNYSEGSVRHKKIQEAYGAWDEINRKLKDELVSSGTVEPKNKTGPQGGPMQARKEEWERDEAVPKERKPESESESESEPGDKISERLVRTFSDSSRGNLIMQVLDSNQLLEMLSFSWDEVRNVLRKQQAEYALLKYRMQTEGTYL